MSENKRAFGSLSAWNALTQNQRDYYSSGHFLTLKAAVDALPVTPTSDKYTIRAISNTDIDLEVLIPPGYTKEIEIDGNGFTTECNSATYAIKDYTYAKVSIHGFKFISNVNKPVAVRSVIYLFNQNVGEKCYYNNEFDINGKLDNAIYLSHHDTDDVYVYNNIIYNSVGADSGGINVQIAIRMTGKYYIENNTIDSVQTGIYLQGGDTYLSNNVVTDCSVANQSGTYTDNGGNNFVLTGANAFVDSANRDYTPKEVLNSGVSPVIQEHTHYNNGRHMRDPYYIGALGIESKNYIIKKSLMFI